MWYLACILLSKTYRMVPIIIKRGYPEGTHIKLAFSERSEEKFFGDIKKARYQ